MSILALALCIITANRYSNIVTHATFGYKAYGVAFQHTKLPPNYFLNLAEAIKTSNFEQCTIQSEKSLSDAFNFHELWLLQAANLHLSQPHKHVKTSAELLTDGDLPSNWRGTASAKRI